MKRKRGKTYQEDWEKEGIPRRERKGKHTKKRRGNTKRRERKGKWSSK